MSKRSEKKKAIKSIEDCFYGVLLEDGTSLHETLEIDDYSQVLPNSTVRQLDECEDWKKLVCSELLEKFCWNGGIIFMDAKGFKFHAPAYIISMIRGNQLGDPACVLISQLTNPNEARQKGFELFSGKQREAIFNALKYLHRYDIMSLNEEELEGLHAHWSKT